MRPVNGAKNLVDTGTLILIGGSCTTEGGALNAFVEAIRESPGPIVGIATASAEPELSAQHWRETFTSIALPDVVFPAFVRSDPATDAALAARIDEARGVFLGGGDQVKLITELSGSLAEAAIRRLFARGGVVCGTSAGAAALTELTMAGGELDERGELVEQYIGPGLGLLGYDAIVDTHFGARRRLQRLFLVIANQPQLFGLGIDEDTALVVRGSVGEVFGAGAVTFVDGRDSVRFDNAYELECARQFTLSNVRVGIVGTNYKLNLEHRELDVLVEGESAGRERHVSAQHPPWLRSL